MGEWSVFLPLERPSWDHISYRGLPRVRSGGGGRSALSVQIMKKIMGNCFSLSTLVLANNKLHTLTENAFLGLGRIYTIYTPILK